MKAKALEIRDKHTFIPALAVDMNAVTDAQTYLLRRAGYACNGKPIILLTRADGHGKALYDPYEWGDRTFVVAHVYIQDHWDELRDGDVIDVEFIVGETQQVKRSERYTT